MTDRTLYFVEHFITDKKGWDDFMKEFSVALEPEDVTIDKGWEFTKWEGNQPILKATDTDGNMTIGLWSVPNYMTITGYKEFMDRFTGPCSKNEVYAVKDMLGAGKLEARGFMRDFINIIRKKESPGYLDAPMLWYVHHHIHDVEGWNKVMGDMATAISKCNNPSEVKGALFEKGYAGAACFIFGEKDVACLWSAPEGTTKEEFQKMIDRFSKGTATNTNYIIDQDNCINVMNVYEDEYNKDCITWARTISKATPESADTKTTQRVHIATQ